MKDLDNLLIEAKISIGNASCLEEIEARRIAYLGRKAGKVTSLLRQLPQISVEERPEFGKRINQIKAEIESWLDEQEKRLKETQQADAFLREQIDISLAAIEPQLGKLHPLTVVMDEIIEVFTRLGFEIAQGPEIELSYYNFDALNIPKDHPAREMHDTFYISDKLVLRTHTSPVQIRVMKEQQPPLRIIVPGRVYRRDADICHSPMFHQVEGLLVDESTTFGDLKGVLSAFAHLIFGPQTRVRFRPSFFPFTEPSAEMDIGCLICQGKGCGVCKQSGWVEILGAGMVDPEVFKEVDYDSERYIGFAFGLGIERITMLKYSIDNIRLFFENDLRFLEQF